MLMLIADGSLSTGSHDPYCGTPMPLGPSTPSVGLNATRKQSVESAHTIRTTPGPKPHEQLPPDQPRHGLPDAAIGRRMAAAAPPRAVRCGSDRGTGPAGDDRQLPRLRRGILPPAT